MHRLISAMRGWLGADTSGLAHESPHEELLRLIGEGDFQSAFPLLNEYKARRRPLRNMDLFRALCFLDRQQEEAAIEALKEELRYFPDNQEAVGLLSKLTSKNDSCGGAAEPEFSALLAAVRAYTMLSEARLFSLFTLVRDVCREDLPGNIVECGVAAGGSTALMAAVSAKHSKRTRRVFGFDTFEGMPAPVERDKHGEFSPDELGWGTGTCAAPQSSLVAVCSKLEVNALVQPVAGLFSETLPVYRECIGPIALLHMDGDWYESTRDVLVQLYDQVVPSGRIQIDDYGYWQGCREAIHEFAAERNLDFTFHKIDETGVWLQK